MLSKIASSSSGIGFPVLMTKNAHVSNLTFTKIFEAELDYIIKNGGKNMGSKMLKNVNDFIAIDLIGRKDLMPKMKMDKQTGRMKDENANADLRNLCEEVKNKNGEVIGYKPKKYQKLSDLYSDLESTFGTRKLFFSTMNKIFDELLAIPLIKFDAI
jgi:hypothetical protein